MVPETLLFNINLYLLRNDKCNVNLFSYPVVCFLKTHR